MVVPLSIATPNLMVSIPKSKLEDFGVAAFKEPNNLKEIQWFGLICHIYLPSTPFLPQSFKSNISSFHLG